MGAAVGGVGASVGVALGANVGAAVGESVGAFVGGVGAFVGVALGASVGVRVGESVGAGLGATVGARVGGVPVHSSSATDELACAALDTTSHEARLLGCLVAATKSSIRFPSTLGTGVAAAVARTSCFCEGSMCSRCC